MLKGVLVIEVDSEEIVKTRRYSVGQRRCSCYTDTCAIVISVDLAVNAGSKNSALDSWASFASKRINEPNG